MIDWFLHKLDQFATWLGRGDPFIGLLIIAFFVVMFLLGFLAKLVGVAWVAAGVAALIAVALVYWAVK